MGVDFGVFKVALPQSTAQKSTFIKSSHFSGLFKSSGLSLNPDCGDT